MAIAILLFGLIVGVMHATGPQPVLQPGEMVAKADVVQEAEQAAAEPISSSRTAARAAEQAPVPATAALDVSASTRTNPYEALARAGSTAEMNQMVADLVAASPDKAGQIVTIAIAQRFKDNTIGDVAMIAASATKAAPEQAVSIAGAVARSLKDAPPGLSAAVASIIVLVPEQTQQVATVVGAVVGDDATTLGMVAQTVAIASGQEVFGSLSTGSGASVAAVMKESSRLGIQVPFEVPDYAAQTAPQPTMVADTQPASASEESPN